MKKQYLIVGLTVILFGYLIIGCKKNHRHNVVPVDDKDQTTKPSQANIPIATGTFWQLPPERMSAWSDKKLAQELVYLKNAGLDVLVIHHSAFWDVAKQHYQTYIPNEDFAMFSDMDGRDPLDAIFTKAESLGIKIVLCDFLLPSDLRYERPQKAFDYWLSAEAMNFRRTIINRYKDSPSFYGYYIPNEFNPDKIKSQEHKELCINSTKELASFVKNLLPRLKIIHPIGLYLVSKNGGLSTPTESYLEDFWSPWINGINQIDTWLMIDGIGTTLSNLKYTDMAQAWGKQIAHYTNKEFWVEVENAVMTSTQYYPFTIDKLKKSLDIAVKHADKIVLFEHLTYMSPNTNAASKKLYDDYIIYRDSVLSQTP